MIQKELTVTAEEGLHARPASLTTNVCQKFKCDIKFSDGSNTVDPKSILGVMMLGAKKDQVITVITDGADEELAMLEIQKLFMSGFKE